MDALRVAVRVRPEETNGDSCILTNNGRISIIKAGKGNRDHLVQSTTERTENTTTYEFDRIFGTDSTQDEVSCDEKNCIQLFPSLIFSQSLTLGPYFSNRMNTTQTDVRVCEASRGGKPQRFHCHDLRVRYDWIWENPLHQWKR